jgi:hypothetical protein
MLKIGVDLIVARPQPRRMNLSINQLIAQYRNNEISLEIAAGALEALLIDCPPFDTNNAWGFGGAQGTKWVSDDGKIVVKRATAFLRHLSPVHFLSVTVDNRRLVDMGRGAACYRAAVRCLSDHLQIPVEV